MHSLPARANQLSSLATTVLSTVLLLVALTTFLLPSQLPPASLRLAGLRVYRARSRHYGESRAVEYAAATFDLTADLQPLFNWNTKQLFVYLQADYTTPTHAQNKIVLWDRIVRSSSGARINIAGGKPKYAFNDITESFRCVPDPARARLTPSET